MVSKFRVEMSGEEAGLFQALQKIIAQNDKVDDSFKKSAKTSTASEKAALQASKAQAKSAREGAKLVDDLSKKNETLNDSYRRRKKAIEAAGAAGVKSEKEVQTAVKQLKKEVIAEANAVKQAEREKVEAARKGTRAYKEQQSEINKGIATVNRLKMATRSLDQEYAELKTSITTAFRAGKLSAKDYNKSLEQLSSEHKRLKQGQKRNFGSAAITQVGKYAASFLTVAAAVGIVRKALQLLSEERSKAVSTVESLVESRTSLRQISRGNFDEMEASADRLASDRLVGITRVQARQLKFSAESTGFAGDANERFVARADRVIPLEQGMKMAGEFRQQFIKEGLSVENAMDTFIAAAAQSVMNAKELTPQIQKAAQGAKAIGAASSDVASVTAVFAAQFGDSSGQRVRMLQENLFAKRDLGFEGAGLIGSIEKLRDDPELQAKFTAGNKELSTAVFAAVNSLNDFVLDGKSIAGILTTDAAIERAQTNAERPLMRQILEASDQSTLSGKLENARRFSIAEESRSSIKTEKFAAKGFADRIFLEQTRQGLIDQDAGFVQRALVNTAAGMDVGLGGGGSEDNMRRMLDVELRGERSNDIDEERRQEAMLTEAMKQTLLLNKMIEDNNRDRAFQPIEFRNRTDPLRTKPLSVPGVDQ